MPDSRWLRWPRGLGRGTGERYYCERLSANSHIPSAGSVTRERKIAHRCILPPIDIAESALSPNALLDIPFVLERSE